MSKILWNSLFASPAILGAALLVSASAMAAETGTIPELAQPQATAETKLSKPATIALQQLGDSEENLLAPAALSTKEEAVTAEQLLQGGEVTPQAPVALKTNEQVLPAEQLLGSSSKEKAQTEPALVQNEAPSSAKIEVPAQVAQTQGQGTPATTTEPAAQNVLQQLNRYSNEGSANSTTVGQVTSVSQLSDVQPTDWAFQALQNLVERYGCIAGYPDGTFRGNRALTRYEFAAGLNACLETITQLIGTDGDYVTKADLAALNRLLEEFQAELATLRGRVDALEARTAELEANQFSTTTKLVGEAIFAGTDSFGETNDVPAFQQRVRLNLNTSFTGEDLLITRLQVGNAEPLNVLNDSREGTQTFNVYGDTGNQFILDTLEYFFPFGETLDLVVAANAGVWEDFTPTLNPYMEDFDGGNGSLSAFGQRNPIYRLGGGQGVGANIRFGRTNIFNVLKPSSLTLGYLASEGSSPDGGNGFFSGDYSALAQLNFTIGGVSLAATYINSYFGEGNFGFDNGASVGIDDDGGIEPRGFVGTNIANTLGGRTNPVQAHSYGLQASLQVSPRFGLSGWVGYSNISLLHSDNDRGLRGDGSIWNYAITLAFPDLLKEGNLAGIVVGAQPYLTNFRAGDVNIDSDEIPWHVEGFYKYQLTDNISLTPGVIWLLNPNQSEDNPQTVIGTLRGTFTF
ncbi:iron uptake porin [Microcoleus sp. FACHB-672]|uniref:iron uptake porin n=1 Tax=Microcoleus sp. FACHB-672 TaxID=2692825 RepID=UPI0016824184|nr:iron uptake porin [Microcoleus sp. FACHB-672]MBD2042481.1 iron uptake porin [Microcoleus sp. FACHB-672]